MPKSWSSERKRLEEDLLCDVLKGRVKYIITSYRKSHDQTARFAVRIDDKEVIGGSFCGYNMQFYRMLKALLGIKDRTDNIIRTHNRAYYKSCDEAEEIMKKDSIFQVYDFAEALLEYKQSKISESIASDNALVRLLAVVDRRIGKRTLEKIKYDVAHQPKWLQQFYILRLDAENIKY